MSQLTADHSYVAEQVRAGAISEEGARKSRFRNIITRAVGIEPTLEAEVSDVEVKPGDILLLCTDGLSNMVDEPEMIKALGQSGSAQTAADKLVSLANRAGGKDNITAIVARLQAGTRTLRMQTADFARPEASGKKNSMAEDRSVIVGADNPGRQRHGGWVWPSLAALFLLAGLGVSGALAGKLQHAGYKLQAAPPFAVPPSPSAPPPAPLDLAHLAYDAPTIFYAQPVRGSFLAINPKDGAVTVAPLSGTVVGLPPGRRQPAPVQVHPALCPPAGRRPRRGSGRRRYHPAHSHRPAGQPVCVRCHRQNAHQIQAERRSARPDRPVVAVQPAVHRRGRRRHAVFD